MEKKVDRILSMGGRLQRLLDEAEAEANNIISEAKTKADEMINEAQQEAEYRLSRAQMSRGIDDFIEAEEDKARKEAQDLLEEHRSRVEEIKKSPSERREEAIKMIIEEVLPE